MGEQIDLYGNNYTPRVELKENDNVISHQTIYFLQSGRFIYLITLIQHILYAKNRKILECNVFQECAMP